MSWRTVVISTRCKLDCKMGYMVVRGEEVKRIFLDEIALVLIENPAVSITGCLIDALNEKKIKVIFCNGKRNPVAELLPYHGCYDCSRKLKAQIGWPEDLKGAAWADIISEKIRKQSEFLSQTEHPQEAALLHSYLLQVEPHDKTNREGHAAKVYFNALFGMSFTRNEESVTNAALNYGYMILLSAFNREIMAQGYLTQLGIFHDNMFNHYNLSCDFMEPFRILIDREVHSANFSDFGKDEKHRLLNIMKLAYKELECLLPFPEGTANELVVENKPLFLRMVSDLAAQAEGQPGSAILSIDNTPVEISKFMELCSCFAPFSLNRKSLLSKLQSAMERQALDSEHYLRTNELLSAIEAFADDLSLEYSVELRYNKLSVSSLLRSMGIEIEEPTHSPLETILDYMELVRELDRDKLFVMVNMRCFFSDSDMVQWIRSACSHDFKVLLLESTAFSPLSDTKRYIVDEDLCEIY